MIYLKIHIGLGDIIAQAAIINKLAYNSNEKLILPTYKHNEESVRSIFVNVPNIEFDIIDFIPNVWPYFKYDGKYFALGHYTTDKQNPHEDFVEWFYRQAKMTYEERAFWCPIKEAAKLVEQVMVEGEYDFVHDHNFPINHKSERQIFRPEKKGSILRYVYLLENATEIHCIDSSFFHLAETVNTTGELFYHINRPDSKHYNPIKNWKVCL